MLIEGPVVTAAGAFSAALGYMNLWIVFFLSILSKIIPDIVYYVIGFWTRKKFLENYGHYLGLTRQRIEYLENLLENHTGKALTIIKLVPLIATPGLILAGASRIPIRRYTFWSIVLILPTSIFYLMLGYYFGEAYKTIERYFQYGGYALIILLVIFAVIYYGYRKLTQRIGEKVEKS